MVGSVVFCSHEAMLKVAEPESVPSVQVRVCDIDEQSVGVIAESEE